MIRFNIRKNIGDRIKLSSSQLSADCGHVQTWVRLFVEVMHWQLERFVENSSTCLENFFTFRGFLIVVLISLFVLNQNKFFNWWQRKSRPVRFASSLPGPRPLPIIGNALEFAGNTDDILDKIVHICSRFESPFRLWLGPKLFVVTTDPRHYEIILGSGKAAYKDSIYRMMEPFVGQGLISGSGPIHRAHRKTILPMFNNKSLSIFFKYFNLHSRICVDLLKKEIDTGEFDIFPYMAHCTVDITLETIFGIPGTTQKNGHTDLVYWTERLYGIVHTRMMKIWLHYDKVFHMTKLGKEHNVGANMINSFVEKVISEKRKEFRDVGIKEEYGSNNREQRVMILDQLIAHVDKFNDMSDEELRDEIYTLFTAAQDTTAVISSFAFLMLSMHPAVQDKVRDELDSVVGNQSIDEEHLPKLKYLEMVIRETLRLFPIAPVMVRQLKGDVQLDSCTIPEGCSVVLVPYMTQRNPKYWQEPEKFIPERFREHADGRNYANVPFSAGPRACIGQKFAIMCLKTIIANVVKNYKLSSDKKLVELELKTDISVRSRSGRYEVSLTRVK